MRMLLSVLAAGILLFGGSSVAQNPSSTESATANQGDHAAAATITGCVKAMNDQFYLQEKDGTRHTLLANGQDLNPTTATWSRSVVSAIECPTRLRPTIGRSHEQPLHLRRSGEGSRRL